jgi:hypothetical protein
VRIPGADGNVLEGHGDVCGPGQFVGWPAGNQNEAVAPTGDDILGFFLKPIRFARSQANGVPMAGDGSCVGTAFQRSKSPRNALARLRSSWPRLVATLADRTGWRMRGCGGLVNSRCVLLTALRGSS